jgi:N-acetyl-beta-hexosaminidase
MCRHVFVVTCLFVLSPGAATLHASTAGPAIAVIPKPVAVEMRNGTFELGAKTQIFLEPSNSSDARWVGNYLSRLLSKPLGRAVPVHIAENAGKNHDSIVLSLKPSSTAGPEGYEMRISRDAIHISAHKVAGFFLRRPNPAPDAPGRR